MTWILRRLYPSGHDHWVRDYTDPARPIRHFATKADAEEFAAAVRLCNVVAVPDLETSTPINDLLREHGLLTTLDIGNRYGITPASAFSRMYRRGVKPAKRIAGRHFYAEADVQRVMGSVRYTRGAPRSHAWQSASPASSASADPS